MWYGHLANIVYTYKRATLKSFLIIVLYILIYLTDHRLVPKTIVEMAVAGAYRNLKLSEYYVLGSHSQIYD